MLVLVEQQIELLGIDFAALLGGGSFKRFCSGEEVEFFSPHDVGMGAKEFVQPILSEAGDDSGAVGAGGDRIGMFC